MTDITYWVLAGGGDNGRWRRPEFRSTTVSPDGQVGAGLRHYWDDKPTGMFTTLTVIGPSLDEAHAEYLRLWEERRSGA